MDFFVKILGLWGLLFVIGLVIFAFVFKYSIDLFDLIERHTMGTRTYILERLEMMFIEVNPNHVTYMLLFLSFGQAIITIIIFGFLSLWMVGLVLGIILFFVGWKLPKPLINYFYAKRMEKFQGQMVDALTLLANGLRAGLSLPQSMGMVVDEMPDPIAQEFNVILQQNKIGVPLDECFENLVKRMPIEDNEMFVSSINILRETGGNLPEVFSTIVEVIRERVRLAQKIATATAQATFQGLTLFAMPFVMALIYTISDPASMAPLVTTPIGIIIIVAALGLDLLGGFIMWKIVQIKV